MKIDAASAQNLPVDVKDVWDETRVRALCEDVGPSGLGDLLCLFHADMPFLLARLNASIVARDAETVDRVLAALRGAAAHLGLKSIEALSIQLRAQPLDAAIADRLSAELARIRCVSPIPTAPLES